MSRWGSALASAAGAAANVGVQAIDRQIKLADNIEAEQRAADLKLSMAERMMAMEEAQKLRAAERFATMTGAKLGEEVPVEAPGIDATGIRRESASESDPLSIDVAPENIAEMERVLIARMNSPALSAAERAEAKEGLEQLERQKKAQGELNAKSVEGKTRKRSLTEARDSAFNASATSDPGAFMAGQSMWKSAMSDERTDAKDKASASEKQADRTSREKIAGMQVDQRAASTAAETERKAEADRMRNAAATAKAEALAGGKGAKATAMMQNFTFLTEKLGKTQEEAEKVLFQAKDSSEAEKVFKMLKDDKYGELTVDSAFDKVRSISAKASGTSTKPRLKFNVTTGELE